MRSLLRAVSFLTVLPVDRWLGKRKNEDLSASLAWFPVAGLIPGSLAYVIAFYSPFPSGVTAFFILLSGVLVSGGLHLDGLADWADGLGARRRKDILRIMKDTSTGAFGAAAVCLCLIGKFAAIFSILVARKELAALVLAPVIARWTMTLLATLTPYARPNGGTGKAFIRPGQTSRLLLATIFLALVVLFLSPARGLLYCLPAAGGAWLLRLHSLRRIQGLTGDILGADCEMMELLVLLLASLI
jgi:adenosylcobinamide-GDP ribazoletransferase